MSVVDRHSKLLRAVECCFRKVHNASPDACNGCPYSSSGSTCQESMFDDLRSFLHGYNYKQQVEIGFNAYGEDCPICPQCEYQLRVGFSYCPKCGTAIDWGDFEETDGSYYIDDTPLYDDYSETSRP